MRITRRDREWLADLKIFIDESPPELSDQAIIDDLAIDVQELQESVRERDQQIGELRHTVSILLGILLGFAALAGMVFFDPAKELVR